AHRLEHGPDHPGGRGRRRPSQRVDARLGRVPGRDRSHPLTSGRLRVGHPLDIVPLYLVTLGMIPSDAMERSTTMDGGSHMTDRRDLLRTFGVIGGAMLLAPSRVALAAEDCQQAIRDQATGNALLD